VFPYKRPTDVSVLIFVVLIITLSLSASYSGIGIARADSVIATIPVGHEPFGIAFDSSNAYLYVTNYLKNGSVSVISGHT
jgi:DNA-binding beta-propeller fold protein YncE